MASLEPAAARKVRIPYLDFAEDFIKVIQNGEKKATTRCPGPKDTDVTSDLEAIMVQGWALAVCQAKAFALLAFDRVETRKFADIDDGLAQIEGMTQGAELQSALLRFYPDVSPEDEVVVLHFHLLKTISE
ncbi:hypothetical protein AK812_SmicGene19645 [Symbiodinium microadriaticum]|uniref:ASCH domain-containing protein n=1 Tax=Symbiodinium microadriaticum TaxID=2951 RepID=A0A1Q9DRZ0_SYMMI|nr:hypothetical protein AK812_SmicGene19645 [Symbiodinium microadriaticum]